MVLTHQAGYETALKRIKEAARTGAKSLYLGSLGLISLPPELWELEQLTSLDLHGNPLAPLPATLGRLINLTSLELHDTRVAELPVEVGRLTKLTLLSLSHNRLTTLPLEIGKLENLTSLAIRNNQLESLPASIGNLTRLKSLYAAGNQLAVLPHELGNMVSLRGLELHHNQLTALPPEIGQLGSLVTLELYDNLLTTLPPEIGHLISLTVLELQDNRLTALPAGFGQLSNLVHLNLSNNFLKSLPAGVNNFEKLKSLYLGNNPLAIPPEILNKYSEPQAILGYHFSQAKKALNECKVLVVGQGSVGKTSLVQQLVKSKFNPSESKTEGIAITRWEIGAPPYYTYTEEASPISLNIWDFGGQEIMHATHQFFLTKRSLYLLVLDSRLTQEENRVEYWLKIIQSFGGDSPVLVVGNKTDQHPLDIDRTGLQKKYPNIVGIFETSAATGSGMNTLRTAIQDQIYRLPHVRDLLPETWFRVKKSLEQLGRTRNFIHHDEFLSLCGDYGIDDESSQRTLIGFMHDLGIILHFQDDPRLEALGILNPQWVTNGVYKILNAHDLFHNKGVLTSAMLNKILDLSDYPSDKRLFIVDMMKKFELCYDMEGDGSFLVPDLLPKDEPFTGEWDRALAFQYHYTVLPTSVITRFIVRMNEYIRNTVWRAGVVLGNGEYPQGIGNLALIKADTEDKRIYIWVSGTPNTRRDFLSLIRGQFEAIHKTITKLEVRPKVPVPGHPEVVVDFEHLTTLERKGIDTFIPEGMEELVTVRQLLNGVLHDSQRQPGSISIHVDGDIDGTLIVGDTNRIEEK